MSYSSVLSSFLLGTTIVLTVTVVKLNSEIRNLESRLIESIDRNTKMFDLVKDIAIAKANDVQDSLEERIGTIENEMDALKYMRGMK